MIYNTESSLFQSFLSSGKHKPTSDEVIDALNVIKAETPNRSPEQMAATLRAKYPQWVLEDLDWAELSRKMGVAPALVEQPATSSGGGARVRNSPSFSLSAAMTYAG